MGAVFYAIEHYIVTPTVKQIERTPAKHTVLQILLIMTGIKLTVDIEVGLIIHSLLLLNPNVSRATKTAKPAIKR